MKLCNPTIKESYSKTLQIQSASISLEVSKVFVPNNGTNFFIGSKIEENVSLNFKSNDNSELRIAQVREKDQGCIKRSRESENHQTRYSETKKLRERFLYDGPNHILLTIWKSLLKMKIKELTQWYTTTSKIVLVVN